MINLIQKLFRISQMANFVRIQTASVEPKLIEELTLHDLVISEGTFRYSAEDRLIVSNRLQQMRDKGTYNYDIMFVSERSALQLGLMALTSRNFGYDFALLNAAKSQIHIYFSHQNRDKYSFMDQAPSLSAALAKIEQAYLAAAKTHLP